MVPQNNFQMSGNECRILTTLNKTLSSDNIYNIIYYYISYMIYITIIYIIYNI